MYSKVFIGEHALAGRGGQISSTEKISGKVSANEFMLLAIRQGHLVLPSTPIYIFLYLNKLSKTAPLSRLSHPVIKHNPKSLQTPIPPKLKFRVLFPLHDLDMSPWLAEHALESQSRSSVNVSAAGTSSSSDAYRKSSLRRGHHVGGGGVSAGTDGGGSVSANGAASSPVGVVPSPSPVLYDLVGLVQHTGGLDQGHYTSYAKDDGSSKLLI